VVQLLTAHLSHYTSRQYRRLRNTYPTISVSLTRMLISIADSICPEPRCTHTSLNQDENDTRAFNMHRTSQHLTSLFWTFHTNCTSWSASRQFSLVNKWVSAPIRVNTFSVHEQLYVFLEVNYFQFWPNYYAKIVRVVHVTSITILNYMSRWSKSS
jgi:hypothetical protein